MPRHVISTKTAKQIAYTVIVNDSRHINGSFCVWSCVHLCVRVCVCLSESMCVRLNLSVCASVRLFVSLFLCICWHMCVSIYVCMYLCVYVLIYVFITICTCVWCFWGVRLPICQSVCLFSVYFSRPKYCFMSTDEPVGQFKELVSLVK